MYLFVVSGLFVFFSARGHEECQKIKPDPPKKSTENDPLGLLKGPIGASLRFMQPVPLDGQGARAHRSGLRTSCLLSGGGQARGQKKLSKSL